MSARGEQMKLVRNLRKAGFEVTRTGGGHWKVTNSAGEMTILSFSPKMAMSPAIRLQLKKMGYKG